MTTDLQAEMRNANYFAELRGDFIKPFSERDIRFGVFVQHLKYNCSQREKDLVYFANNFHMVYGILHIDAKTLKEGLPVRCVEEVIKPFSQCAYRLGFQDLILEGLPPELVKLFELEK